MNTEGLLTAKEYKSHTALAQTMTQCGMTLLIGVSFIFYLS